MSISYVGVDDTTIDLFEGQYPVPQGISYNSYVIMDEKIAIMDTIDKRTTDEWLENLKSVLKDRSADYLIVSHMEPDHASNIEVLTKLYPQMKVVASAKAFPMIGQFFPNLDLADKTITVKEGDTLCLGQHTLQFFMAPMVHWPEVMMTYEQKEKILFSADAFGKFGALQKQDAWDDEARRYYLNIVGKFGTQVQNTLKKLANLEISAIYPLHGPVLSENLGYYLEKYQIWSSYRPEEDGVLIAYASIYGNTKAVAMQLADYIQEKYRGPVILADLAREEESQVLANAFRFPVTVFAASSYEAGVFTPMENFLRHLGHKL
ncbi:MAG TPA: FprA family A-type flavoprotein, partial [Lachnospiraceae bacterium]